jgi:hypothetical protein
MTPPWRDAPANNYFAGAEFRRQRSDVCKKKGVIKGTFVQF